MIFCDHFRQLKIYVATMTTMIFLSKFVWIGKFYKAPDLGEWGGELTAEQQIILDLKVLH